MGNLVELIIEYNSKFKSLSDAYSDFITIFNKYIIKIISPKYYDGQTSRKEVAHLRISKVKEDDQIHALQFGTITREDLQAYNISTQQIEEEMDTEVEAKVEVDITKEANSRGSLYKNY